jgi:tetratricopeptide (TPR) repeat protein
VGEEPENELAWLWLARCVDGPSETVVCLRKALEVNPESERVRPELACTLIQEGIGAAQRGEPEQARTFFLEAADLDPANESAWLWAATVAPDDENKRRCLERVLDRNPDHPEAKAALELLQRESNPAWSCPFCVTRGRESVDQCPRCRAFVSLRRLDAMIDNPGLDRRLVESAVERYQDVSSSENDPTVHLTLALAYLNLGRIDDACNRLRRLATLRADDEDVASAIRTLEERARARETGTAARKSPRFVMIVDDSATVKDRRVTLGRHITASSRRPMPCRRWQSSTKSCLT